MQQLAIGRLVRALPATAVALAIVILIFLVVVFNALAGNIDARFTEVAEPLLFLFALCIILGLVMDGSANARAKTHWDDVLPLSATDLERLASGYFADKGWEAQRDDADFKVFTRRTHLNIGLLILLAFAGVFPAILYLIFWSLSRPEAMTVSVTPVPAGARIEMVGPNAAMTGFYTSIAGDLQRLSASHRPVPRRQLKADG